VVQAVTPRLGGLIIAGGIPGRSGAGAQRAGCCPLVTALLPQPLWSGPVTERVRTRSIERTSSRLPSHRGTSRQLHPIE
jgi:hypothetical protein